jgi:2-hydroxychromene-2-carboxylate isomerase
VPPTAGSSTAETASAVFYFDLASPLAYLAAERIQQVLGGQDLGPIDWQPVLARDLPAASSAPSAASSAPSAASSAPSAASSAPSRTSSAPSRLSAGGSRDASAAELRSAIELRAAHQGAPPIRWPPDFPFDSEQAMLVATYAKSIGRATAFAQAAFRQAFAGGRSLALTDNVVIAAAACEMHPAAVLRAAGLKSLRAQLSASTSRAAVSGVGYVPAVQIGSRVFVGEDAPEQAAAR